MEYNKDKDCFICNQGQELKYIYSRHYTSANAYGIENRIYRAENCKNCPLKDKCFSIKREYKEMQVSLRFLEQRKKTFRSHVPDRAGHKPDALCRIFSTIRVRFSADKKGAFRSD